MGSANAEKPTDAGEPSHTRARTAAEALFGIAQGVRDAIHGGPRVIPLAERPPNPPSPAQGLINPTYHMKPNLREIMVFDNLNSVSPEADKWFPFVAELSKRGLRVFIVIIDGGAYNTTDNARAKSWAYLADIVIRLGRRYPTGYMIHTLEVLKARYQRHVFGRHQMKLVPAAKRKQEFTSRDHPYRREGGIFIFPSMHLALSRRKLEKSNPKKSRLLTPFDDLNDLLADGFFEGRCVALAGGRGTHKSRLAFAQVLKTLSDKPRSRAIIISLREEEGTVEARLAESLPSSVFAGKPEQVGNLVKTGRLELCYYPPGFIAPEEFFHRVQLSVARQKKAAKGDPVLLVFNSLDLLHSHYPLCAEHSIFVPALVELLCLAACGKGEFF
jgi:KaiC/GvpD/RAD55 family RecA-like ATPase